MTNRELLSDLAKSLREAAKRQDPLAQMVIKLVKLSADDAKENLVTADGEDMYRLQGAARAFTRLHRELTTNPPSMTSSGV